MPEKRSDCYWRHSTTDAQRYPCMLFFQRFYAHPDPWKALRAIHASVRRDFRPARDLGLTLVLRDS